jgi:hypothetical protein
LSLKADVLARRIAELESAGNAQIDAYRAMALALKCQCRADGENIRLAKQRRRQASGRDFDVAQSELARLRRVARARPLIYGFVRGRQWVQMEANHAGGDRSIERPLRDEWLAILATFVARFPLWRGLAAPGPVQALLDGGMTA